MRNRVIDRADAGLLHRKQVTVGAGRATVGLVAADATQTTVMDPAGILSTHVENPDTELSVLACVLEPVGVEETRSSTAGLLPGWAETSGDYAFNACQREVYSGSSPAAMRSVVSR